MKLVGTWRVELRHYKGENVMTKTVMTKAMAFGAIATLMTGAFALSVAQAEGSKGSRGGVANTSQGTTTQGSMVSDTAKARPFGDPSNENIAPAAGNADSTAPRSNNKYGTTGSNLREDIKQGR